MSSGIKTKGKKILITGGAGFIGTCLCERLIEDNEVTILDNFHRDALKFTGLMTHPNLKTIMGDVTDLHTVKKYVRERKYNVVVHLAAIAGVGTVVNSPALTLKVNLIGTYNVLEAIKNLELERFISFSTSEVYGPHVFRADELGMTTQGPIGEPRWVYAVSKIAGEHLGYGYFKEYGLPFVSIRPFNIYGPKQVGEGAVHHFIICALRDKDLIVHDDGNQIRSWCYIDDMIDGVCLCLKKKEAVGNILNIGNPQATSTTLALAERIIRLSNSRSRIIFKRINYPDVQIRIPSIEKAHKLLGYEPKVNLNEGLLRTMEWYKRNMRKLTRKDKALE